MTNYSSPIHEYSAAGTILKEQSTSDIIERVGYEGGIKLYLKDRPFPFKGYPTPEALIAVNIIKKLALEQLSLCRLVIPKKSLASFAGLAYTIIRPHILKSEYQTPITRELERFTRNFLEPLTTKKTAEKLAQIFSHIVEYDSAYRFRLEDMLTETSKTGWLTDPHKELCRAVAVSRRRDYEGVSKKVSRIGRAASIFLCFPAWQESFRNAVNDCKYENFQLDPADTYWLRQRTDYTWDA